MVNTTSASNLFGTRRINILLEVWIFDGSWLQVVVGQRRVKTEEQVHVDKKAIIRYDDFFSRELFCIVGKEYHLN
jgi:hypothetical protein